MKRIITTLLFICALASSHAQTKLNLPLKHELDSMYVLDQRYRELVSTKLDSNRVDSLTKLYKVDKNNLSMRLMKLQTEIDSSNIKRVEVIIKQYGYPGKTLVGEPTNEAAFYVLQHSTVIDKYLPLIEKAVKEKQLPFYLYAMMKDRSLMYNKKEQIWGTQAKGMSVINKETNKIRWVFFIWPIADPARVNKRRKEAGFPQTVEDNAKRMGLTYKVYTLEQAFKGQID
jgi:hypothetical protein